MAFGQRENGPGPAFRVLEEQRQSVGQDVASVHLRQARQVNSLNHMALVALAGAAVLIAAPFTVIPAARDYLAKNSQSDETVAAAPCAAADNLVTASLAALEGVKAKTPDTACPGN